MEKIDMTTLSSVMEKLRLRRQDNEFTMKDGGLAYGPKTYQPDEVTIIKTFRFEGDSDPADSVILYLIEANDGLIGYSIDVYGANSNNEDEYDEFIKKVKVVDRGDNVLDQTV